MGEAPMENQISEVIASENQPVWWTTPLGLPVVQPYFITHQHVVEESTGLGSQGMKIVLKTRRWRWKEDAVVVVLQDQP